MNQLYLTNASQQPATHPFVFSRRNEKIDWRRIAAVDVERVARDLDFKVLQDNIEQITLCNIDMEVDTRMMDPNFVKLYKMAQLTIEYLLLCQDQITTQLVDYEQTKTKSVQDREEYTLEIKKLKNELNTTKKESKKRKKLLEEQQKLLMTQQPPHHTCPVCAHSFLSLDYLQAHIHRRHPEMDSSNRREHDVDLEKENQRLKEELHNKDTELQVVKTQKAAVDEKILEREETIRQLNAGKQVLENNIAVLTEKYYSLLSTIPQQPSPSQSQDVGLEKLLKENKDFKTENDKLKQELQDAEKKLKKEEKRRRKLENDVQTLQQEINDLNERLRLSENFAGDTSHLRAELVKLQNKNKEERNQRKIVEEQLDAANKKLDAANRELAQLRNQPPPITGRRSPVPPPRTSVSPPPAVVAPRPPPILIQTNDLFLPQHCPKLVQQLNRNPRYLATYRDNAKRQFNDEIHQHDYLDIDEKDTRLSDADYVVKMRIVEQTRRNIQDDLPNFENIRRELSQTLDRIVQERLKTQPSTSTSHRSSGGKLVKFEDESPRHNETHPTKQPSTTIPSRPKDIYTGPSHFHSDDESSQQSETDNNYYQPSKPVPRDDIQPSPRKNIPSAGISALVTGVTKPVTTNNNSTISALVRPKSKLIQSESESEESTSFVQDITPKPRVPDQKSNDMNSKGKQVSALPQAFMPTHKTLATRNDDDDDSDSSLTSIHDTNPRPKPTVISALAQNSLRPLVNTNTNQNLSSGEMSQYTYDSLMKSPMGKGTDFRRPQTADSAKSSMLGSDEDFDRED